MRFPVIQLTNELHVPISDTYLKSAQMDFPKFKKFAEQNNLRIMIEKRDSDLFPFEYFVEVGGFTILAIADNGCLVD